MTFKVGDIVVRKPKYQCGLWPFGNEPKKVKFIFDASDFIMVEGSPTSFATDRFELAPIPIDEAKKLLIDAGYIVTEPKPKRVFEVEVIQDPLNEQNGVFFRPKGAYKNTYYQLGLNLIATVRVTEGEFINDEEV